MTLVSFEAAHDVGDRFLGLLHKHGINPPVGSGIENELLSLVELLEVAKNPSLAQGPSQVAILRSAAGVHDFAAKLLSVEPIPEFSRFLPHLQLIAESKVLIASLGQNASSGPFDDTARKMAELYIGCLAAYAGTDVRLDHPTKSVGDNPDVLVDVSEILLTETTRRWALAVKTISSKHGQTIFERIKEGSQQIDSVRCQADVGMIVINAKSALDHESLWNPTVPFSTREEAANALRAQLDALVASTGKDRASSEWDEVFNGRVVRPVLFMGQSLVKLPTPVGAQTPTALKLLMPYDAVGTADPVAAGLAEVLNDYMQKILLGIPGSPGQEPR